MQGSIDTQAMADFATWFMNSGAAADGLHNKVSGVFFWAWNANSGELAGLIMTLDPATRRLLNFPTGRPLLPHPSPAQRPFSGGTYLPDFQLPHVHAHIVRPLHDWFHTIMRNVILWQTDQHVTCCKASFEGR